MIERESPPAVSLRPATASDGPFLSRLYADVRKAEVAAWGWPPEQQEMFLRMQFEAQRRSYAGAFPAAVDRIVVVDDADAGRMLAALESSGTPARMHLVDIALLSEYRNRGVGTGLIRELQRECESLRIALRLQVLAGNPAIRLYRRLGFVALDARPMYVAMEWVPDRGPEGV